MGGKCHNPHFTDEETSSLTICELTASKWQKPRSSADPWFRVRREMKISEDLKDYESLLVISPFRESLKCSRWHFFLQASLQNWNKILLLVNRKSIFQFYFIFIYILLLTPYTFSTNLMYVCTLSWFWLNNTFGFSFISHISLNCVYLSLDSSLI